MDLSTQSSLLAAIVSLALAVSMLLRTQRARTFSLFALVCLSFAAWYLARFLFSITGAPFWLRVSFATAAMVPSAVLEFLLAFLGIGRARRERNFAFVAGLTGWAVATTPLVLAPAARAGAGLLLAASLAVALALLQRRMRQVSSRVERQRLAYLFYGGGGTLLVSLLDFLPSVGIPFPSLGPLATIFYLFFFSHTLQVYRLLDLNEFLGRIAALSALALILAAIFVGLVVWARDDTALFLFNTLVASVVVLSLVDPLRTTVESWVSSVLFRERAELLRTLSALKVRLAGIIDPLHVARVCLDTFHESRRITHGSIYLLADSRPGFSLIDSRGPTPVPFLDAGAARGLLAIARSGQKAVLRENVERRIDEIRQLLGARGQATELAEDDPFRVKLVEESKLLSEIRSALNAMKAGICIPLIGADRVIGFLNLWDERVPEAFASDEIALMLEVGEQIATVVENSKLYERMRERDRLAALGEMAAGLAHEIRNPLGAIKGAAQYLAPAQVGDDDGEILQVIIDEVDRLNAVVTQFLDYARPVKPNVVPVDVNEVVDRTVKLLQVDLDESIAIELQLDPAGPMAMSDPEQLKQVLVNLVQNAVQAMPAGGRITLSTGSSHDDPAGFHLSGRSTDFVEIRVKDTGPGLPEEHREHIFVPFFTTKKGGTGLGLAISQRIIRSHGGTISAQSRPGEGAEFLIRLPAAEKKSEAVQPPEGQAASA
ncbi:MAG: ATP-binding protein [Pseudomonadota bacterium]|nr:MAG: histidine kinase [Pseudomonadota bacterium]